MQSRSPLLVLYPTSVFTTDASNAIIAKFSPTLLGVYLLRIAYYPQLNAPASVQGLGGVITYEGGFEYGPATAPIWTALGLNTVTSFLDAAIGAPLISIATTPNFVEFQAHGVAGKSITHGCAIELFGPAY